MVVQGVLRLFSNLFGCGGEVDGPPKEDPAIPPLSRLILISVELEDLDSFVEALLPNVHPIVYDPATTSRAELADLILEHGEKHEPVTVALACPGPIFGDVAHGEFHSWTWQLVKDTTLTFDGEHLSPVTRRKTMIDALQHVLPPKGEVHIFSAEVAANPEGRELVQRLEEISGLRWAASVGVTEEAWTLLCHGKPLDVGHMYFHTEKIAQWKGTMAAQPPPTPLDDAALWSEVLAQPPEEPPVHAPAAEA
jgi:hypothetical protein